VGLGPPFTNAAAESSVYKDLRAAAPYG